jgi:hypothetical protein
VLDVHKINQYPNHIKCAKSAVSSPPLFFFILFHFFGIAIDFSVSSASSIGYLQVEKHPNEE